MKNISLVLAFFFCFGFKSYAQPGGTTCASAAATQITLPFYQANLTNCGANNFTSTNTLVCGNSNYLGGADRLYAFTPITSGFVICTLTTGSTTTDIGLMLYQGCPTSGVCISNSNGDGGLRILQGEVTAGLTYYLLVSTMPTPSCITNYSLAVSLPGSPAQGILKVDCIAATPICNNYYQENLVAQNEGLPPFDNEIDQGPSFLGTGEKNGFWYSFSTTTAGSFTFLIDPNNDADDYDWALFDITSYSCSDIFSTPSLEVSCNWSGISGNTGISSTVTGAQWESVINLISNRHLMLYISNFTQSIDGYGITLGGSATIIDTEAPTISGLSQPNCGDSTLVINFSEAINCNNVDVTNFILDGPGGPYTIDQTYTSLNCSGATSNTSVSNYTIKFNPPLTASGIYTFSTNGNNSIYDRCGNSNFGQTQVLTFTINSLVTTATVLSNVTCFGFSNAIAKAMVPSNIASYTYQWNTTPIQSTRTATGLSVGTYTLSVTSTAGCTSNISTITITEPPQVPLPTIPIREQNYCKDEIATTIIASYTGVGPGQLSWYTIPVGGAGTITAPTPVTTATGRQIYYVSQTKSGCQSLRDSIIVDVFPNPLLTLTGPSDICSGEFATYTVSGATSYTWSTGNISDVEIIAPLSNTTLSVTGITTATCQSQIEKNITIKSVDASITMNGNTALANATNATYQWIICDGNIISGATSQTFQPLSNGSYAVIVTQNACADTSDCFEITTVGLSEKNKKQTLSIFPNPNDGEFSLELNNATKGIYTVQITNAMQQIISIQNIIIEGQNLKQNINLKQSSKGVYFIKINSETINEIRRVIVE